MAPNKKVKPSHSSLTLERNNSAYIQRKLAWRMGIAGLTIAFLLGALAIFDHMTSAPEETRPAPQRFTEPVPVAPKNTTQALGPVVPVPPAPLPEPEPEAEEDFDDEVLPDVPEPSAVPESTGAPVVKQPTPDDVASPPEATPAPPPRSGRQRVRPSAPTPPPPPTMTAPITGSPLPPRRADPKTLAPPDTPSSLPRLSSGYLMQAGVFADPWRAEEVAAKLQQEGIPVRLETRVLVGPFKSESEAEAAYAKLRKLGIDVLMAPRGSK